MMCILDGWQVMHFSHWFANIWLITWLRLKQVFPLILILPEEQMIPLKNQRNYSFQSAQPDYLQHLT